MNNWSYYSWVFNLKWASILPLWKENHVTHLTPKVTPGARLDAGKDLTLLYVNFHQILALIVLVLFSIKKENIKEWNL